MSDIILSEGKLLSAERECEGDGPPGRHSPREQFPSIAALARGRVGADGAIPLIPLIPSSVPPSVADAGA